MEKIPGTDFYIGQRVYFKSIHGHFEINYRPAVIFEYNAHEKETPDFPKGLAICIEFDLHDNYRKTWARIDEIHTYNLVVTPC